MKKSRKSFLLAMMAILVAAGLAGCGRGNSASGQQTENANGQTDQLAPGADGGCRKRLCYRSHGSILRTRGRF